MLPLALVPMLRSVLVIMPRQALAALSVMEPVMGRAVGQGTKGSDLKMASALELRRNNALNPPTFDIAIGAASSIGDCPSLFFAYHILAKSIFIPIATYATYGILSHISAERQLCDTWRKFGLIGANKYPIK